ncbi:hypothetical protein Tco_0856959, partial [Tanacetum coccineum]
PRDQRGSRLPPAGALTVTEDAPTIDEGDQAILAPMQALQQPPLPPPVATRTMP